MKRNALKSVTRLTYGYDTITFSVDVLPELRDLQTQSLFYPKYGFLISHK